LCTYFSLAWSSFNIFIYTYYSLPHWESIKQLLFTFSYVVIVFYEMALIFADIASSPQNVTVSSITNTSAVISWKAPSFTDALPVYTYILRDYETGMELGRTEDNTTSITIGHLYPAMNYSVVVIALTRHRLGRIVEGNISDVIDFTTEIGCKSSYC